MSIDKPAKAKRGFAAMSVEQRRAIASQGGKAVPSERRSFSLNPDLAVQAGKKGGGRKKQLPSSSTGGD